MKILSIVFTSVLIYLNSWAQTSNKQACEKIDFSGINITCLQQGVGSLSVLERSDLLRRRINQIATDLTFDIQTITVVKQDPNATIMAGDTPIISLSENDTEETKSIGVLAASDKVAERIRNALTVDRVKKSPEALMLGAGLTFVATLVLIIILFLLKWVYPKIYSNIRAIDGKYVKTLKFQSYEIINSARIIGFLTWAASVSRLVLTLVALYIYIPLVFSFFPWTADWTPKLYSYIVNPLVTVAMVIIDYIPNLFFIVVISIVTRYVLRAIYFFFYEIERGNLKIDGFYREWADPTYKLVRLLIFAFALVMIFPYLPGSSSPAFQGISVFLGILLSLGSSSAIANIVSGVVITYMRPFKLGDRVKIADTMGDVIEKSLLVTRIKTIKNEEITIPNSMVLGSHIINYSTAALNEGLILNTTITIGYEVPRETVTRLLLEAARRTQLIDLSKKPFVLNTALNDFAAAYQLNAYTAEPNKMAQIYSDLHFNIQECFNEANIEIISPHYSALRDGNETTIPKNNRSKDYVIPKFRLDNQS